MVNNRGYKFLLHVLKYFFMRIKDRVNVFSLSVPFVFIPMRVPVHYVFIVVNSPYFAELSN